MELKHLLVAEAGPGERALGLTAQDLADFAQAAVQLSAALIVPVAEVRDGKIVSLSVQLPRLPIVQKPEF